MHPFLLYRESMSVYETFRGVIDLLHSEGCHLPE